MRQLGRYMHSIPNALICHDEGRIWIQHRFHDILSMQVCPLRHLAIVQEPQDAETEVKDKPDRLAIGGANGFQVLSVQVQPRACRCVNLILYKKQKPRDPVRNIRQCNQGCIVLVSLRHEETGLI